MTWKKIQGVVEKVVDKRKDELELKMELRFNATDKRFEKIEKQMDHRFDTIEKQMDHDRRDWSQFFNEAGIFLIS